MGKFHRPGARRNCSGGLWLPGDLALDLFSELQGMIDFFEQLGRASRAAHDHRSVAQDSPHSRLIDHYALDSGEKNFDAAAIRDAGFCDYPLVGDSHLRGITFQQTDREKNRSDYKTKERTKIQGAARRSDFDPFPT